MRGTTTPALLTAEQAARYLGIGLDRFRRVVRSGNGPRVWNPDGGRPMYGVRALDEWAATRNDGEVAA